MPRLTLSLLGSERASKGVREPRPESPGFSHGEVQCLSDFLNDREGKSNLQAQMLTIDMVTNAYISMCRKRRGEAPVSKFKLANKNLIEEYSYGKSELCSGIYCRS